MPVAAMASNVSKPSVEQSVSVDNQGDFYLTLDEKTKSFLKRMTESGVMKEISSDKKGNISLLHNDVKYLKTTYNLNKAFIEQLKSVVADVNNNRLNASNIQKPNSNSVTTQML